jgi:hypothetical protein
MSSRCLAEVEDNKNCRVENVQPEQKKIEDMTRPEKKVKP